MTTTSKNSPAKAAAPAPDAERAAFIAEFGFDPDAGLSGSEHGANSVPGNEKPRSHKPADSPDLPEATRHAPGLVTRKLISRDPNGALSA